MNVLIEHGALEIVSTESLERELNLVRAATAGPLSGVFGPQSLTWQINREAAIFLGAGRALLLQLSHPWVAAQHSDTFADPIGRFHRTFGVIFTMVFGTLDQSVSAARLLHHRHDAISGTLRSAAGPFPAGSFYCANAIPALRWVHATLIETALVAHALTLPPLTREQHDRYYAESQLFAALFGIPKVCLSEDWNGLSAYIEAMAQSDTLTVTDSARAMAQRLLAGADTWLPVPASYKALTAGLLPPRLRDAFALPYSEAEQRAAEQLVRWVRRIYPLLPSRLRYVGPYQEAEQRLAGSPRPDSSRGFATAFGWAGPTYHENTSSSWNRRLSCHAGHERHFERAPYICPRPELFRRRVVLAHPCH
jgi:uncharacterized protein (DUF2236 family)